MINLLFTWTEFLIYAKKDQNVDIVFKVLTVMIVITHSINNAFDKALKGSLFVL